MRVWSPGARVGHAWLKVLAMKGILAAAEEEGSWFEDADNKGIDKGRFGFEVAEVGSGGSERISGVKPGTKRATTRWIIFTFCGTA